MNHGLFIRDGLHGLLIITLRHHADFGQQAAYRIEVVIGNALFERNDRVVGDMDMLRANFRTAFCDVAHSHARIAFELRDGGLHRPSGASPVTPDAPSDADRKMHLCDHAPE